jgi:hypothetical protein
MESWRKRFICVRPQVLLISLVHNIFVALLRRCMVLSKLLVRGMIVLYLLFMLMDLLCLLLTHLCFSFSALRLLMYLLVYVDDIIFICSFVTAAVRLVIGLGGDFVVKDLGKLYFSLAWRLFIVILG